MREQVFGVKREVISRMRTKGVVMLLFLAGVSIIGLGIIAGLGFQAREVPGLAIVTGVGILIFLDTMKKNAFGIFADGLNPSARPLPKVFSRKDYFVAYKEIAKVELREKTKMTGDPEAHPFTFLFTLRSGRTFFINPVGGFQALGRYIKTEREMVKVYKLLKVVMAEVNRPENQAKGARGEDVIIPRARFEAALT